MNILPKPNNKHNPKWVSLMTRLLLNLNHLRAHKFKSSFQDFLRAASLFKMRPNNIQFVIFKPLSYCFERSIGFDVKALLAWRPV